MVDVKSPKCIKCKTKRPNFNKPGETKALYRAGCADSDMVNVKSPRCIKCKTKIPVFNKPGETKALYCAGCADSDMVDVKSPKCIKCKTRASYGIPCNPPTRCSKHKESGMIVKPNSKCKMKNCNNKAEYGIKNPIHCEKHKETNEVSLVERKCSKCGRIDLLIKNICVNFCNTEIQYNYLKKHKKTKEERVVRVLKQNYKNPTEYNKRVDYKCGGKNQEEKEIGYDYGTHKVFIEVDENQHKSYCHSGEYARMRNIYMNEGGIPILYIRYNPDNFRNNKIIRKIPQNRKEEILIKWIKKYENFDNIKYDLSVHYLFYDNHKIYGNVNFELKPYEDYNVTCEFCKRIFYLEEMYKIHKCFLKN